MYEMVKDWGNVILRAAIIIVALYFFFWPARLEGSSMEPALQDGDLVCVSRFMTMAKLYQQGDLVVFHYNHEGQIKTLLKRVIATEGEHIEILADGTISLNGSISEETYANGATEGLVNMTVPIDTVFVLGDNRGVSFDSRQMGVIPTKDLIGKVLFRWYPFSEMTKF